MVVSLISLATTPTEVLAEKLKAGALVLASPDHWSAVSAAVVHHCRLLFQRLEVYVRMAEERQHSG